MFAAFLGYLKTGTILDYQDLEKIRKTNPTIVKCGESGRLFDEMKIFPN